MRVQDEVLADLALQAQLFTIGGEQQLDSSGIKADTMVHGFNLIFAINALQSHHAFQYLCVGNQGRVTGEQGLDVEGFRGLDYIVNPVSRNIYARQLVNDLVNLGDNDTLTEFSCFNDCRSILGAEAGEQVALSVSHGCSNQSNTRGQIQEITAIQFEVGVDSAELQLTFLQELSNTTSLGAGEGHIQLFSDALFEYIQMLRQSQHGLYHVQIMNLCRINLAQAFCQEVSLLLVVAFDVNLIKRFDYCF